VSRPNNQFRAATLLLQARLASSTSRRIAQLVEDAGKLGISRATLYRAAKTMGVTSPCHGFWSFEMRRSTYEVPCVQECESN
jgi:hypothetical protein